MNIQPVLLFCFLSVLQDGNIGLINAQIPVYTGTEGENITVTCSFIETGSRKFFCKDECERPILTFGDRAQSGRYSMRYVTTLPGSRLDVTITQLRKPDSGRYRCGLDSYGSGPYHEFGINVRDAPPPSKPKFTPRPAPPTPPQSFRGSTTPSSSTKTTNQQQTETTAGGSGMILYLAVPLTVVISVTVAVSVTVVVVLLAVFLLLYKWKKRSSNDVNSRGHLTDINMESIVHKNSAPVSTLGESDYENDNPSSTYETLNPATMSPDQTYSTIGQQI